MVTSAGPRHVHAIIAVVVKKLTLVVFREMRSLIDELAMYLLSLF